ncbi:MAG: acetolactate synthase large subunit [bacterium]
MRSAELFLRCLENEGVEYIFGIPGEENLDVMDSMDCCNIQFVTVRHEQGAAFMADVYGRLTGKAGVCLATLGPGATNLITGVADANMDRAPVIAIAGQGSTHRLHKESHQILDLVNLFEPISKYATQIREPEIVPEIVRKAFKVAEAEKPGCAFIDFPENIAATRVVGKAPLKRQQAEIPEPSEKKLEQATEIIKNASHPLILAGNGVLRARSSGSLLNFAERSQIPVATTFMAKGAIASSHSLSLGSVGLSSADYVNCGFDRADVVICIGYDIVEYHPMSWNHENKIQIIHIDSLPAEVDEHYQLVCGIVGHIGQALDQLGERIETRNQNWAAGLRESITAEWNALDTDDSFPMKPQRILSDVRKVLQNEDILISDVGAHKMWIARLYQAEAPNTCIISNGFASMGIGVPGAIAAKFAVPNQVAMTITGDAGFLMNSQEIETALRWKLPIIIMIWNDSEYGLIKWHQQRRFARACHIDFTNPNFVAYAESFGAKGYRVESADQLIPTIEQAITDNTVVVIDVPVDYSENMKLTEKLGNLVCPI